MIAKTFKKDSWEHYLILLNTHNFDWAKTDDTRTWLIDQYIQEEKDLERLRLIYDKDNEFYNRYSPYKK